MVSMAWRLRRAAVRLQADRVAVRDLLAAHGPGGQGALLMLLAVPCVLPVPGVGTLLGLGIAATAWAMWRGHVDAPLPQRVASLTMPRDWARRVLMLLAQVYGKASVLARRRWSRVATAGTRTWVPAMVALMAVLIVLPIPFGNLLPALALLVLGAGLVFLDGVLVLAAAAAAVIAALFPIGLVFAAWDWGGALTRGLG